MPHCISKVQGEEYNPCLNLLIIFSSVQLAKTQPYEDSLVCLLYWDFSIVLGFWRLVPSIWLLYRFKGYVFESMYLNYNHFFFQLSHLLNSKLLLYRQGLLEPSLASDF